MPWGPKDKESLGQGGPLGRPKAKDARKERCKDGPGVQERPSVPVVDWWVLCFGGWWSHPGLMPAFCVRSAVFIGFR